MSIWYLIRTAYLVVHTKHNPRKLFDYVCIKNECNPNCQASNINQTEKITNYQYQFCERISNLYSYTRNLEMLY